MSSEKGEPDTEADEAVAGSRTTGGVDEKHPNQASTTDTSEDARVRPAGVAGDDIGYAEETGAERRAEADG